MRIFLGVAVVVRRALARALGPSTAVGGPANGLTGEAGRLREQLGGDRKIARRNRSGLNSAMLRLACEIVNLLFGMQVDCELIFVD